MSAATAGAGCGVVLGIVLMLLAQQLSFVFLGDLVTGILYIVLSAVVLGVIGAIVGYALGRRYLKSHPGSGMSEWKQPPAKPA